MAERADNSHLDKALRPKVNLLESQLLEDLLSKILIKINHLRRPVLVES